MATKIKVVGDINNPELISVQDADVHYIENVTPGTKIVRYKGQERKVTVTADGKVPTVKFNEPTEKGEKAQVPKKPKKVEATVETGIEVTSDPSQLVIYWNKSPTEWKTPETLRLDPGEHWIGVEGNITGDGPVTVTENEITKVHIVV